MLRHSLHFADQKSPIVNRYSKNRRVSVSDCISFPFLSFILNFSFLNLHFSFASPSHFIPSEARKGPRLRGLGRMWLPQGTVRLAFGERERLSVQTNARTALLWLEALTLPKF